MNNKNVDMLIVEKNRQPIGRLGSHLGGAYFTIGARETYPKFDQKKVEIEQTNSLDFIMNRSPRRFEVRDHAILAQCIETDATGTTRVVFNPGTDEEAKASVVAGMNGYGQATEDAIADALHGQNRIFVDGVNLVKKANGYNQDEVDRLNGFIKELTSQRDAILSTMRANEKKVSDYTRSIVDSTPKPGTKEGDSVSIVVEPNND